MIDLRCPHCQTVLADAAVFCGRCGQRVAAEENGDAGMLTSRERPVTARERTVPDDLAVTARLVIEPTEDELLAGIPPPTESQEMAITPRASRRPLMAILAFLVAGGTAGAGHHLYTRLRPPPPRHPVVVDLDAEPAPLPPLFDDDEELASPQPTRQRPRTSSARAISPTARTQQATTVPPSMGQAALQPQQLVPPQVVPSTTASSPPAAPIRQELDPPQAEADDDSEERQAIAYTQGIKFVVHYHKPQIAGCYESTFKTGSPVSGRLDIGFIIDTVGRARKVATLTNSIGNSQLATCIEQLIADWQFPRPPNGEFATSYPFVFSGG